MAHRDALGGAFNRNLDQRSLTLVSIDVFKKKILRSHPFTKLVTLIMNKCMDDDTDDLRLNAKKHIHRDLKEMKAITPPLLSDTFIANSRATVLAEVRPNHEELHSKMRKAKMKEQSTATQPPDKYFTPFSISSC